MGQKKKQKKRITSKVNLEELRESRNGGQIALRGYSYQFLYSCYLILSSEHNIVFSLEGIEDIDTIKCSDNDRIITHIQLKYSKLRQDASFMDSILKNYLEVYLNDTKRCFKLVYDFSVSEGNLKKLFTGTTDKISKDFWKKKIDKIKNDTPLLNWSNYNFDDFISKLSFDKIEKSTLEKEIENSLVENFEIEIDNISLFANGIKILCFDKMENRGEITYHDINKCIENIKFDISKGYQNPAHTWIQKLDFSKNDTKSSDYYEGKKATPSDIANNIPIIRPVIEKEILDSIANNTITIIKTSSGQGKTTLALRTISLLTEEYMPYQITWCNEVSELGHIVEYFHMRTRIGEKPIILLDNLDAHLKEWNRLVQFMQTSVKYHYKIIVTSRESDWYHYGGDISNIHSLQIIKPILSEKEARDIFCSLKKAGKLHQDIINWKNAWLKIADRQLLIEYVYLLTHGKMIDERISEQLKEIGNAQAGGTKFEILRKVCFADICGIKLETKSLIRDLNIKTDLDIGEVFKSLADEFLVHISTDGDFIEGLHPVRSQHIVNRLHEYLSLEETALSIAKIAVVSDIPVLFSHYPEFDFDKNSFYSKVVDLWLCEFDLSRFVQAIRGTFSGSVMQYFRKNKTLFDDAHKHGGLTLVAADLCPFTNFESFEQELDTLNKMAEIMPDNTNIQYLIKLRDSIPQFISLKTDIYCLNSALYLKLKDIDFRNITDLESYAIIVEWLYNIDLSMNLTTNVSLNVLWNKSENYSHKVIASLMYSSFRGNKDIYNDFTKKNILKILEYLKRKTKSHSIQLSENNKEIKVEYILKTSDVEKANEESVSRLKDICCTLPIFEKYCSDAIKPQIDLLAPYQILNIAHKEMPKRNIIITFHQEFNSLWLNTIESNYEFETVYDWTSYWFNVRKYVCDLLNACCLCMYRLLGKRKLEESIISFGKLYQQYNSMIIAPLSYPREHRPFTKKLEIPIHFNKVKTEYFFSIQNVANQLKNFITHEKQCQHLVIYNLKTALSALQNMQIFFDNILLDDEHQYMQKELCAIEEKIIMDTYMCCEYYLSHQPSTYFNKCQIKDWYLSFRKAEIEEVNSKMIKLIDIHDAVLPKNIYFDNIFLCYPILLRNFEPTNELMMSSFLTIAATFAETPYDYLILLVSNDIDKVEQNAIKFPKKALEQIYNYIHLGTEEEMNHLSCPYPIQVTQKMLDCFEGKFIVQKQELINIWCNDIVDIGEDLWIYSKNREILINEADNQYLSDNLNDIKNRIDEKIRKLSLNVSEDILSSIDELCNTIYNGEPFGDEKLNELISCVQDINI